MKRNSPLGVLAVVLLLVCSFLSCSSPSGNVQVTPVPRIEQRVAITVSRGLQPEFRWSPDSGLAWLHVGRQDRHQLVWEIVAGDSANSIRQPVRYSVVPSDAKPKPTIPLEPGVEYELSVGRYEMYRNSMIITQIARVRFRAEDTPGSAASPPSAPRRAPCGSVSAPIDTTRWTAAFDREVGVELLLPDRYVAKHWASVHSPPGEVSADWWMDNGVQSTITVRRRPDSSGAVRSAGPQAPAEVDCALNTASGPATLRVDRSGIVYVAGKPAQPYIVEVSWPAVRGQRRQFVGVSGDTVGRDEHIRMAATVHWLWPDSLAR